MFSLSLNRKVILILLSLVALIGLYVMGVVLYLSFISAEDSQSRPFTASYWAVAPDLRFEMTTDLIASKQLIGLTPDEVEALLGDDYYQYNQNHWGYYVGFVPRFAAIDPDVLDIQFESGVVIKVWQHES